MIVSEWEGRSARHSNSTQFSFSFFSSGSPSFSSLPPMKRSTTTTRSTSPYSYSSSCFHTPQRCSRHSTYATQILEEEEEEEEEKEEKEEKEGERNKKNEEREQ